MADEFKRRKADLLPEGWDKGLAEYPAGKAIATRKASEEIMQVLGKNIPELIGGTADLNNSVFAWLKGMGDFQKPGEKPAGVQGAVGGEWGYGGRNIHFGVREHAMGSIANGLAAYGGILPFTGTFFVFSDYMRPPIRLAAISQLHVLFIFTHDSIGVGEDGPTHQPIEQLMALRAVPNLTVLRPADANETLAAWKVALQRRNPTVFVFSRQNLPILDASKYPIADGVSRGAYVLASGGDNPDIVLIATGSEVTLALRAADELAAKEGARPRRLHAFLGALQGAGTRLPRRRDPAGNEKAPGHRGRGDTRLVALGGRRGRRDRPGSLRGLGAGRCAHGEIRLHRGECRRTGH